MGIIRAIGFRATVAVHLRRVQQVPLDEEFWT
jgi:hypothetical protein